MTLTTPMKVILAIVIILVIGLGFYLLSWQPKMADLQQLKQQAKAKEDDHARIKNELNRMSELIQENERLQREYNELVQGKFKGNDDPAVFVSDFIDNLEKLVEKIAQETGDPHVGDTGFYIVSIQPGAGGTGTGDKKDKQPSAVEQALARFPNRKFQINLKGRYSTLVKFLDALGGLELNRLVTVDKISLTGAGDPKDDPAPNLGISLPLTAYLRTGGQ